MLKSIRNINSGWILMLIGLVTVSSGLSMTDITGGGQSLICFDGGCLYAQGISNIAIGFFCVAVGIYMILKK